VGGQRAGRTLEAVRDLLERGLLGAQLALELLDARALALDLRRALLEHALRVLLALAVVLERLLELLRLRARVLAALLEPGLLLLLQREVGDRNRRGRLYFLRRGSASARRGRRGGAPTSYCASRSW
jgi:hypothetical protein